MRSAAKGIQISLMAHVLFFALIVLLGRAPSPVKRPIVIDFTLQEPVRMAERTGPPRTASIRGKGGAAAAAQETKPSPRETSPSAASEARAELPAPAAPVQPRLASAPSAVGATVPHAAATNGREPGGSGSASGAGRGEQGSKTPAGDGKTAGAGDSLESAKRRYFAEHFAYIKDLIAKNQVYPAMARKMGWKGAAIVSFVVCEDGSVEDVMIKKSSGFDLLDRKAMEAVRKAAPFPRPPVRAELSIPITYTLQ